MIFLEKTHSPIGRVVMSNATSSLRFRLAVLLGALGFVVLPLVAQGDPPECYTECHDIAMGIEDDQDGPMWEVANFVFLNCIEEECEN